MKPRIQRKELMMISILGEDKVARAEVIPKNWVSDATFDERIIDRAQELQRDFTSASGAHALEIDDAEFPKILTGRLA